MTICTTVSRISLIWTILVICSFALAKVGSTQKQPLQRKIDRTPDEFVTRNTLDQARIIRKINNDITDLWGAVQHEFEVLQSVNNLKQAADEAIGRLRERIFALKIEAEELSTYNHNWMRKKSEKIIKSIEQKIKRTQNPTSCRNASKLAVRIEGCGFGCLSADLTQKFDIALKYDKVFIAIAEKEEGEMKTYAGGNMLDFAFDPISACSKENITKKYVSYGCRPNTCESLGLGAKSFNMSNHKLVEIYMNLMKRDFAYTGYSASKEQWADISSFHGNPRAWWNGHLRRLLFRPQDWLAKKMNYIEGKINFNLTIVGIHVRRSDKLRLKDEHTEFHVFEKYMKHVEYWYDRFDLKNVRNGRMQCVRRRIYLVTDDPDIWFQINRYKRYQFLGNLGATYAASIDDTRNTLYSLKDILIDTAMLSKCNYFVGTLSSRVATMVYEMMQTNRLDGAEDAFSLDHSYGDPYEKNLFQQAVYSHRDPSDSGEFHMNPGDLIALTTKNFNGTYFGENQATLVYGYYPSYKVKPHPDIFVTAKQDNTQQFVHEADDED